MHSTCIKVLSDNETAVAYIRNMGGTHSRRFNNIIREILLWRKAKGLFLVIAHLPEHLNVEADTASQVFNNDTQWSLDLNEYNPLARRKAPAKGQRPEGANIDWHLVPYHGKQGESNLASSLFIYIYMYGTLSL